MIILGGVIGLCSDISEDVTGAGPTEVGGIISTDTTWMLQDSPYVLTADVQVPKGIKLTIEPGVEIRFNGAYEILIKGIIIANGEVDKTILFTNGTSLVTTEATMLKFRDSNLSNSQLSHVRMENAAISIQIGEETEHNEGEKNNGTLIVSHPTIDNSVVLTDGYDTEARLVLTHAVIRDSTIRGNYPRSEEIIIEDSTIIDSVINSDSYNRGISIKDSYVTNCSFKMGCCGANIHILSSVVSDSPFEGCCGSPVVGPLELNSSTLINSPVNLPAATLEILHSRVFYNGPNGLTFGNGLIESSIIMGKREGIALTITGNHGYNVGRSVTINNSMITHNLIGIRIYNANIISIQNNNIYNNTQYNLENLASVDITAPDNFWGTGNMEEINALIFDYYDDINYGKVIIDPFRMEAIDLDSDNDGTNNSIDDDDDDDTFPDSDDEFPLDPTEWYDTDGDEIGDNADTDDDNDGYSDVIENELGSDSLDPDSFPSDNDNDFVPDEIDEDDDNDTFPDDSDAFPFNSSEWLDTDNDGIGNNADLDDDNDGHNDAEDAFPLDPDEWTDTDNDGIGNNTDWDDDGDGIRDTEDAFPLDPTRWRNTDVDVDGDGVMDDPPGDRHRVDQDENSDSTIRLWFAIIEAIVIVILVIYIITMKKKG